MFDFSLTPKNYLGKDKMFSDSKFLIQLFGRFNGELMYFYYKVAQLTATQSGLCVTALMVLFKYNVTHLVVMFKFRFKFRAT